MGAKHTCEQCCLHTLNLLDAQLKSTVLQSIDVALVCLPNVCFRAIPEVNVVGRCAFDSIKWSTDRQSVLTAEYGWLYILYSAGEKERAAIVSRNTAVLRYRRQCISK